MSRVLVVGAGLAGLTFAAAMRRAGHDVEIRDERPALGGGAGLTLWPNALAALDAIGLGDAVREIGEPTAAGVIRRSDGSLVRRLDPVATVRTLGEPARVVDRGQLQLLLADHAPPVALGRGVGDVAELEGAHVVGADGYRSIVARHLDPRLAERPAGYVAWRGVAPVRVDPAVTGIVWGDRGEGGALAMPGGRTYWFMTRHSTAAGIGPDPSGWPEPFAELIDVTPSAEITRHEMFDRRQPRHWHDARHVVIGDAAHAMQPGLGQGGCLAIEDAVVLARTWCRQGRPSEAMFAAFERRRRPRATAALRGSRQAGRILHSPAVGLASTVARRMPQPLTLRALARFASRDAGLRAVTT